MSIPSYYYRNMLLQYDRQLVTARRLARIMPGLETNAVRGHERQPDDTGEANTPEGRRRLMIEKVARELLDNLLFTGSKNPVVEEVRRELNERLDGEYTFWYPPGEVDVHVVREAPEGKQELSSEERKEVLTLLWEITLAKVDATML